MREVYLPAIRECLNEDFDLLATEIKTLKLHAGDDDKLRSLLGLKPWEISPLDAVGECRYPSGCAGALSWPKARVLREELLKAGRMQRLANVRFTSEGGH